MVRRLSTRQARLIRRVIHRTQNGDALRKQLHGLRDYMQARIDSGDLDFDDWVYRTRDAANVILTAYFYEGDTNGR